MTTPPTCPACGATGVFLHNPGGADHGAILPHQKQLGGGELGPICHGATSAARRRLDELAKARANAERDREFWRDTAGMASREVLRLMEEIKVLHSRIETQATRIRDVEEDRDFWRSCARSE